MSQQTKSFQGVKFDTKMIEETLLSINDRCLPLAEARQLIFNGKSLPWLKYYVFGPYPEVYTENGGFITKPNGRGKHIYVISCNHAMKWIYDHRREIDWQAKDPKTLGKHLSK